MTEEMRDVDHTHPHTGETFGFRFTRGPAVAADGGEADDADEERSDDGTMADVTHDSDEGTDRAFERGTEGRVHNE